PGSKITNSVITNCDVGVAIKYLDSFEVTCSDVWGNTTDFDGGAFAGVGCFSHDPWYEDAANGVFNYAWSQLTRASSAKGNIGDEERWGSYDGPPRLAVNTIGPGAIAVSPDKEFYDLGEVVTITVTPDAGAELIGWLGDTLDASGQITMDAHRYVTAQFAPVGAEIVDINGSFSGNVDWSVVAMEFKGTNVTFKEIQNGGILLAAGAPDTLTVTTDSALALIESDLYLAIISTKGHSHAHSHNTQVIDSVWGLGLDWEHVATQRGSRNATVLNIYKAQGTPTGDGMVSATMHNFPAGFCIALSVVRYSGVDASDPFGSIVSHNTVGFNCPTVEITGYPRANNRAIENANPDADAYSIKLPLEGSGNPVCAIIAHRNREHEPGVEFTERDEFWVEASGNTNSISVLDKGIAIGVASDKKELPLTFALSQNYPNPFNPETMIKYQLPKSCDVKLIVYNLMGQKVATLFEGNQKPGFHSIIWNGLDDQGKPVSSGLYLYRLDAESFSKTYKMMLVR
ncbi:MAG: T9SS type A sorting domain-containing protein, partial [bacterium]